MSVKVKVKFDRIVKEYKSDAKIRKAIDIISKRDKGRYHLASNYFPRFMRQNGGGEWTNAEVIAFFHMCAETGAGEIKEIDTQAERNVPTIVWNVNMVDFALIVAGKEDAPKDGFMVRYHPGGMARSEATSTQPKTPSVDKQAYTLAKDLFSESTKHLPPELIRKFLDLLDLLSPLR